MNGALAVSLNGLYCSTRVKGMTLAPLQQNPTLSMDQTEMLARREQLMEDIISIMESHDSRESPDYLSADLCEAVCKNFPEA